MTARDRGWGAPIPYGDPRVVDMTVSGVDFPAGVHRRARPVMVHVALRWETGIEPLVDPGCWGHAYRKIAGSDVWSSHAHGLAVDINAPDHPQGERTMSVENRRDARRIANSVGCRWGGDYSTTIDPMHTEFMGTPTEADHIAANLGNDIGKRETVGEDMIARGDRGEIVEQWQQSLIHYFWYQGVEALPQFGADTNFGDETAEWTKRWQGEVGLPHGMVTPADWTVMGLSLHRRDDPAGVVAPGEPIRYDDYSLMDFVWHNRADITKLLERRSVTVDIDEDAIAEELAPKLRINESTVASALREVLREGIREQGES